MEGYCIFVASCSQIVFSCHLFFVGAAKFGHLLGVNIHWARRYFYLTRKRTERKRNKTVKIKIKFVQVLTASCLGPFWHNHTILGKWLWDKVSHKFITSVCLTFTFGLNFKMITLFLWIPKLFVLYFIYIFFQLKYYWIISVLSRVVVWINALNNILDLCNGQFGLMHPKNKKSTSSKWVALSK